jgi:hypothetical protein
MGPIILSAMRKIPECPYPITWKKDPDDPLGLARIMRQVSRDRGMAEKKWPGWCKTKQWEKNKETDGDWAKDYFGLI